MTGGNSPRERLHPLTPVLRGIRMLAVVVAVISWQGLAQLGVARWLVAVAVVLVAVLVGSVVSWAFTGYQIVGRELRIVEGVLWRRHRAIPLERLQAVDVVRPLLARLAGLAELRLEVIGASRTEAPLAFLPAGQARALRERLLILSGLAPGPHPAPAPPQAPPAGTGPLAGTGAAAPGLGLETGRAGGAGAAGGPVGHGGADRPVERLIHRVDNREILVSQVLTPHVWVIPLALLLVLIQVAIIPVHSLIAVASTLSALIGIFIAPARRVFHHWGFRVLVEPAGLRLRYGLLETRSQTLPTGRVQAVELAWPLLWRLPGWLRARIDVAGYAGNSPREGTDHVNELLPVADPATARRVLAEAVPGVDVARLHRVRVPRRAGWLAPLRYGQLGAGLDARVVATWEGFLTRRLVLVPYERIQSVRLLQGPLQRALGLATVVADTAGGIPALAEHRDLADARLFAAELVRRARTARQADTAGTARQADTAGTGSGTSPGTALSRT